MKSRGLSGIISTVILIALAIVIVSIVWGVVSNLVQENLEETESCFGNFDKVVLNNRNTCNNSETGELQFSIEIRDADVDEVLVSVSSVAKTSGFKITKIAGTIANLREYSEDSEGVSLPGKNGGKTYLLNLAAAGISDVQSIKIAPIINGKQCDTSDTISEISNCLLSV